MEFFTYIGTGVIVLVFLYTAYLWFYIRRAVIGGKIVRPMSNAPTNARKRILVIGDSTAYGTGAQDPQHSLVGRLVRDFPDIEIVNAAQNAMDLEQLQARLVDRAHEQYNMIMIHIGGIDTLACTPSSIIAKRLRAIADTAHTIASDEIILVSMNNIGAIPLIHFPLTHFYAARSKHITNIFAEVSQSSAMVHIPLYRDLGDDPLSADSKRFFAADRIHPSDDGYGIWYTHIRERIAPYIT